MHKYNALYTVIFFFLCCVLYLPDAKAGSLDDYAEKDHNACVAKGFFLGKMDDPSTEKYYLCRAELAKTHMKSATSILSATNPEKTGHNEEIVKMIKEFTAKAETARNEYLRSSRDVYRNWEQQQSDMAKQYDREDHQACVAEGYNPSSWGSPDTEKYYLCRASRIEKRAPTPPFGNKNHEKKSPEAAMYFYRKAREAQYAFKAIDYETHHICVEKGFAPGEIEDPKTEGYYRCRAEVAEMRQGPKMVAIFRKKADEAKQTALEHQPCALKGLKKGTKSYQDCRQAATEYKKCLTSIEEKARKQQYSDERDCGHAAVLQFPDTLLQGSEKKIMTLDQYNNTTTTIIREEPLYTKESLSKARAQAASLCKREKEKNIISYRTSLKMQCNDIMNFDTPRQ